MIVKPNKFTYSIIQTTLESNEDTTLTVMSITIPIGNGKNLIGPINGVCIVALSNLIDYTIQIQTTFANTIVITGSIIILALE